MQEWIPVGLAARPLQPRAQPQREGLQETLFVLQRAVRLHQHLRRCVEGGGDVARVPVVAAPVGRGVFTVNYKQWNKVILEKICAY